MADVNYPDYLALEELLSLQRPRSSPEHPDELLFIVVHQASELWFKVIIQQLHALIAKLRDGDGERALWHVQRINTLMRIVAEQLSSLDTLPPQRFMQFRDFLGTSSGQQSVQFRVIAAGDGWVDRGGKQLGDDPQRCDRADLRAYPWGNAAPTCALANHQLTAEGRPRLCVSDTQPASALPAGAGLRTANFGDGGRDSFTISRSIEKVLEGFPARLVVAYCTEKGSECVRVLLFPLSVSLISSLYLPGSKSVSGTRSGMP